MTAVLKSFTALMLAVFMALGTFAPTVIEVSDVPDPVDGMTRIVSFNVRCKDDVYGTVENRGKFIAETLLRYGPDSFGVQEATAQWLALLEEALGDRYAWVGEARNDAKNTEYSAVFYRRDKFTLLNSGTKWLSDTPDKKASKFLLSSLPRVCTWATLQNNETGRVYTHLNTHLDHVLESVRVRQAGVFVEIAKTLSERGPVICTGDFNTEEGARAYKVVAAEMDDAKFVAEESDSGITFHDYGRKLFAKDKPIDFIFVPKGTRVARYRIIDNTVEGMYLSDHYGLCADIAL